MEYLFSQDIIKMMVEVGTADVSAPPHFLGRVCVCVCLCLCVCVCLCLCVCVCLCPLSFSLSV